MNREPPEILPNVLLIDDSHLDLIALLDMLERRRYSLHVAFNGKQGFQRAELLLPDLILLDIKMPDVDGFVTCRLLKANPQTRQIPVIFLTAATDLDMRLEGFALGAVDYITKPFFAEEVVARLQLQLEFSASLKEAQRDKLGLLSEAPRRKPSRSVSLTQAAILVFRKSLRSPPNTKALAIALGASERRVNQAFRDVYELTPSEWLQEERLRTGLRLLMTTDTSINMISSHIGFKYQSNFAKAFRQRFGFTPSEARATSVSHAKFREISP